MVINGYVMMRNVLPASGTVMGIVTAWMARMNWIVVCICQYVYIYIYRGRATIDRS